MLDVSAAAVDFGDTTVLDSVDLTIATGQTMALLGPSGSGKTTLLRAIAGLQPLRSGTISWDASELTAVPPHLRRFGLVFQHFALFPHLDVGGNVAFGLKMAGTDAATRARLVAEALERVELAGYEARPVSSLSGGQAQRVALARALVVAPRMLLLDEPLGALDRELRERLAIDLRELLSRLGITALHVTHDQHEAFAVADSVAVLIGGQILQTGSAPDLWTAPASEAVARFLGLTSIIDGHIDGRTATTVLGEIDVAARPPGRRRLVIRPDGVRLDPQGPIEATVTTAVYRGAESLLTLDARGVILEAITRGPQRSGERVRISIDPSGVSVLPAMEIGDAP